MNFIEQLLGIENRWAILGIPIILVDLEEKEEKEGGA